MSVPLYVSSLILHECLTHVHTFETGCLPPRRIHHRTSRRFPLVLSLVLSLPLQPEPGICACLRPRKLGRLLSASPALRTWGLSALNSAASCVRVACRWAESHPCPAVATPPLPAPRPGPRHATWRFLGLAPRRGRRAALTLRCFVCATPRGGKWALINHRLRVCPLLVF